VLQGTPEFVLSREGVTQGDPLSMLMYAIAVLPLKSSQANGFWAASLETMVALFLSIVKVAFLER